MQTLTGYFKLSDGELWKKLEVFQGGVYKIVAIKDNEIIHQFRFLGEDKEGILYIGKATRYSDRVLNLVKSMSPIYKGQSHVCGRRYKSNPRILEKFPFEILHVQLLPSDNPELLERDLLYKYFEEFGECPPLNALY